MYLLLNRPTIQTHSLICQAPRFRKQLTAKILSFKNYLDTLKKIIWTLRSSITLVFVQLGPRLKQSLSLKVRTKDWYTTKSNQPEPKFEEQISKNLKKSQKISKNLKKTQKIPQNL